MDDLEITRIVFVTVCQHVRMHVIRFDLQYVTVGVCVQQSTLVRVRISASGNRNNG